MKVLAIDPGTRNTGIVCLEDNSIIHARCLSFKESIKDDQEKLLSRSDDIADIVINCIKMFKPDVVVIEGFVNFGVRSNVYTSQTPFLVGVLCESIIRCSGYLWPVIQLSRDVLKKPKTMDKKDYPPMVTEALENVKNAKETCTNEHLRSALAHGYYYLKGHNDD